GEILSRSPDWDGKVSVLQVTGLGAETMQLRALMSAPDSSRSWNLQCEVREKLVDFLQREHPSALPRLRTEFAAAGGQAGAKVPTGAAGDRAS
nr:mechanosensitive ion channel family protein [Actinomycetota bacterium]